MDFEPDKLPFFTQPCDSSWEARYPDIVRLMSSPSFYMVRILHAWQKRIKEKLVDYDLTHTQYTMLASLMILSIGGKPVTQADLATFTSADKMMVSEVLRTLEKKGYISRTEHPTDRRAKSLAVTEKGIETIDVALKETVKSDEEFFSAIGDDREELVRILKKLI